MFEKTQNIITVKKGCQKAQKMIKNWLRRFKIQKLKFGNILLIDDSLVDKENLI